ncbi:MAG: acyl carrier protein [Phycisphaerales bacterium]|nr:acyl carrier protein [Phycisphaerales bacterium]
MTPADQNHVVQRVAQLAAAQANVDPRTVHDETHLCNDLHFDSLDQVEFVMTIEEEFGVRVSEERAADVRTVADVADLILQESAVVGANPPVTR